MNELFLHKEDILDKVEDKKYKQIVLCGYKLFIGTIEGIKYNTKSITSAIEDYIYKYFKNEEGNLFHYEIIKDSSKSKQLIIYTIEYPSILKKMFSKRNNITIIPMQFYVIEKVRKICKFNEGILIIQNNDKYFVEEIVNKKLVKEVMYDNIDEFNLYIESINDKKLFVKDGVLKAEGREYKIY